MTSAAAVPAARKRPVSLRSVTTMLAILTLAPHAGPRPATAAPAPSKLEVGGEERVRTENWDNSTDFNAKALDTRHQWRFRTRAWSKLTVRGSTDLVVGLANESRKLTTPKTPLTMDETLFETLYLEHRFADGASIRAGRQNVQKGDGFLLFDGSPLDGSRVAYLNALDVAWTPGKSRLDLLLISDPFRDHYLPPFHDRKKSIIEWNENAAGLYWSDASRAGTVLDLYWFFKAETGDSRALTNAARQSDRMFHTVGGRFTREGSHGWSFKAEAAGQAGVQQPHSDVRAWGVQVSAKKTLAGHASQPSLLLGWTGLSGDDPRTTANEGWDPLFARWPKWSELYIYTLASEKGAAYWTNLSMFQGELRVTPVRSLDLRGTYYHLGAFHRFPGKPAIYAGGSDRGDLFEARADYKLNDNWRGHVVGEYLVPGDYYAGSDAGWFFRAEVIFTLKKVLGGR